MYHIQGWERHARLWLENWDRPIRIIIFNDFKTDVRNQLPALLQYFGYMFEKSNIHRHCCVAEHPLNRGLKRAAAPVDPFEVRS